MFALDSDTYTHLLQQHPKVVARLEAVVTRSQLVGITIVTKIEVLQGRMAAVIKADSHPRFLAAQQKLLTVEDRLQNTFVFRMNEQSLEIFDQLLAVRGVKKIGRADLLIASIALARDATLVTRNLKHFRLIPRLKLENWVD